MGLTSSDRYSDWKAWSNKAFGEQGPDDCAYFDIEIGRLLDKCPSQVLELGFGNGSFLRWCRERGHECDGIEANPALVTKARNAGFEAHDSIQDVLMNRGEHWFDMVVALDVLEHVPQHDLEELFKRVGEALRPGGLFIARFPNGDSPFGRRYQYSDVTHVSVLGSEKIVWLATTAEMTVVTCKEPAVPMRGAGLPRIAKRTMALGARRLIDLVIRFAYFAGSGGALSANLVVVLRAGDHPSESRVSPS